MSYSDQILSINNGGVFYIEDNDLDGTWNSHSELMITSKRAQKFIDKMCFEIQPVIWKLELFVKIQGASRSPNIEIRITEKSSYLEKGATETGLSELMLAWNVSTTSGTETISRYQINYSNNTSAIAFLKIFSLFYPEDPSVIKSWSQYGNNIDLINKFKKTHGTK